MRIPPSLSTCHSQRSPAFGRTLPFEPTSLSRDAAARKASAGFAVAVLAALAIVLLGAGAPNSSLDAAPPPPSNDLSTYWDAAWQAGRDGDSGVWDLGGAISRAPVILGLSPEDSRWVTTEVAFRRLYEDALSIGRPDRARAIVEAFLEASPSLPASIAGPGHHLLGILKHLSGDLEGARREWDSLGFISDFQMIGPFENERGSGFSARYDPESTIDLAAELTGKRGKVSWRRWSEMGIAGQIELAEMFRPAEESLAYLVTWLTVTEPTEAVFRVGSSGAYKIWLGDELIFELDVDRPIRLDQEAIAVQLHPGQSRLRILTGQTKGRWAFRIRVTDDAGHALKAVTVSAEPPNDPNTVTKLEATRTATPDLGARTRLASGAPSAAGAALAGWIASEVHAHDRNDHPDREAYRQAIELDANQPLLYHLLAQSYAQEVGHAAEREENPRRDALERALELDPTFDRARLALVEYYVNRFGNIERASELLTPALKRPKVSPGALELARRLETARVGSHLAERWQQKLAEGLDEELRLPVRMSEVRDARSRGETAKAIALIDQGLSFSPLEDALVMARAEHATRHGDLELSHELLKRRVQSRPHATEAWSALASYERSIDNLDAALIAIDEALRIAPQAEELYEERGHLLHSLGQDAAALAAWGISLDLEPNQPRLRTHTEFLESSAPGIDREFRIDVESRIAAALRAPIKAEDAYRILLENQASEVQEDGTAVRYHQRVLRILTDAGIRQLDYHVVQYAHGEQWVKVLKARVHHADGSFADARIRNRDPVVREGEYPVWSRAFVDMPPLSRGDVVEIEYLKEDLRQSFFGDYFGEEMLFGGFLPRDETIYTVRFPSGRSLFHKNYGIAAAEITYSEGRTQWRWHSTESNKVEPEPGGPPISELVPRVEVSSYETWDEFATWYHHLIRRQFEASPEIQEKVAELTQGITDRAEQVRVVYEFVANEIRYIAWEFGVHGFLPYNASTIFTRRFGDCKDKATLICTMLGELDIEAWPVLINGTRQRPNEDLSLPLISHFNHCIAYVPEIDGGLFVDGTAENHGVRQLPGMDYGAEIVVVRDDVAERHKIPWNSPDDIAVTEDSKIVISKDGTATIDQVDVFTGDYAVMFRDQFEVASKREELIERILGGRFPGLEVKKITTSDLDDLSQPVTIELELAVPRFVDIGEPQIELPPVNDLLSTLSGIGNSASRPNRTQDLLLGNPRGGSLRIEITIPDGFRVGSLPEGIHLSDDRIQCDFDFKKSEKGIVIERTFRMLTPRIPPAEYESFKAIVDQVEAKLAERIILEPSKEVN